MPEIVDPVKCRIMETRISATELARRLGDILGRIRYRGESFLIERSGKPVARIAPAPGTTPATLREALAAWRLAAEPDSAFAGDLARIKAEDHPPADPRDS